MIFKRKINKFQVAKPVQQAVNYTQVIAYAVADIIIKPVPLIEL